MSSSDSTAAPARLLTYKDAEDAIREILRAHHGRGPFVPPLKLKQISRLLGYAVPTKVVAWQLQRIYQGKTHERPQFIFQGNDRTDRPRGYRGRYQPGLLDAQRQDGLAGGVP
jgi:hypothetical protein